MRNSIKTSFGLLTAVLLIVGCGRSEKDGKTESMNNEMGSFLEKGERAPEENFIGTVWVNMNVTTDDGYNTIIGTVTFEPEARTNWHSHTSGQILMVTSGKGYYQEKGKPIQIIEEGDVVKVPKSVKHWHGASHEQAMTHIAIVTERDKDQTEWFEPVSDEEYNRVESTDHAQSKIQLSQTAIDNHKELWLDYESKAAKTDPELIGIFDNWAFDEVTGFGDVDVKTRTMVILASNIASHALSEYKMYVTAALNVGVSPVEIKEILYQSVPYVGVAKVIDFIYATNEIFSEREIKLPLEGQSTTTRENRHEKRLELMLATFGERIKENRKSAPEGQGHIQEYLAGNCFGDYYTRTGLDIQMRELLTFSMLISMGGTEPQVKGHIQGNANVGNDRLVAITTQLLPYIGYPRTLNALKAINEVLPE
jgi:4-carboxymuconolactone decarboxylase